MRGLALTAFLLGALLSLPALGAMVEPLQGELAIDRGSGFQRVVGTVEADVGDAVMFASPRGRARIVYPDGCLDLLIPGQMLVIDLRSPCKKTEDNQRISSDPARPY
jgi:hypothetical protein